MKSIDKLEEMAAQSYPLPETTQEQILQASLNACRRQNEKLSRQLVRTLEIREEVEERNRQLRTELESLIKKLQERK